MGIFGLLVLFVVFLLFVPAKRLTSIFSLFINALLRPIRYMRRQSRRPVTATVCAVLTTDEEKIEAVPKFQLPPSLGPAVLSGCVLIVALSVILSHTYTPDDKHWAYGAMGTLMGFWLKK